jgi:hypothetical protein
MHNFERPCRRQSAWRVWNTRYRRPDELTSIWGMIDLRDAGLHWTIVDTIVPARPYGSLPANEGRGTDASQTSPQAANRHTLNAGACRRPVDAGEPSPSREYLATVESTLNRRRNSRRLSDTFNESGP